MSARCVASVLAVVAALLLRPSLVRAQEPAAKANSLVHVSGVVVSVGTNVPVPRCHLTLRPERSDRPERPLIGRRGAISSTDLRTAETDPQGRFSFDLPAEGRWQLSASAAGYRTQFFNEHEGFSSAVVLHPGLAAPSLLFHLEPDSAVSGFVRDEAAEPVRNATVALQLAPVPEGDPAGPGRRQQAATDDRGHFEIAGIAPGTYHLSVQATPWYTAGGTGRFGGDVASQTRSGDPSFDVVYPLTWYPGVFDPETAGDISLHAGESQQLDFNLLPIPAAHVRAAAPASNPSAPAPMPTIERVDNGQSSGMASSVSVASGQVDFGNLPPGLYRVTTPQPDGGSVISFVHVAAGATISLAAADPAGTVDLSFHVAGDERSSRAQITLTDLSSRSVFTNFSGGFGLRRRTPPGEDGGAESSDPDHHIAVPPGRYQVTLSGDPDLYLTSMALKQKPIAGRIITLAGGPVDLTLNVARGRATVAGHTNLAGKPVDGAMVMLVPTTFGQAGAIDLLRRDQSDTDGSFNLTDIIPGDYILFAIDRGWGVNWHDPATLNRYLVHGTPLSLKPHSTVTQEIPALSP